MADQKLSDADAEWIVDNWGKMTPEAMATQLGVSRATIYTTRKRFLQGAEQETEIHVHVHIHVHKD